MPDFIKKLLGNLKSIWGKTNMVQKLAGGGVVLAAIVGIILIFVFSSSSSGNKLFNKPIDEKDFDRITTRLAELDIPFTTKDKTNIFVNDLKTKNRAIMLLAEEGSMPTGKYTFLDIIERKNITRSKFDEKIQLRAALKGELERLLESSELIDDAHVNFTMPEKEVFVNERKPVKVAVMLSPAWGVDLWENKKAIKGIQELIINSIDGAERENIVITDINGKMLNEFTYEDDEINLKKIKENLRIRDRLKEQYKTLIYSALKNHISEDRTTVMVDVGMNFDQEKINKTEILPVVLKKDNPVTPYDDGERRYSITLSSKKTSEKFEGPNWIPEGPPGFDDTVPPAYKGALEQITRYIKDEEIVNETFGEEKSEKIKDPWEITKITASVMVDGTYEFLFDEKGKYQTEPDGVRRKRNYIPVAEDDLKNLQKFVEQGIGYSIKREDKVVVFGMKKDRSMQFFDEDKEWRRKQQTTWLLLAVLGALVLLVMIIFIYRIIAKELERRRRLREEELARQHQLAREMALKSAEEEGVEVEMSIEDKARLEMQENAVNMAREHPEDVAQLIRTWLTEE